MKTIENELKMLLTAAEYNILMEAYASGGTTERHINYYYDTPSLEGNAAGITYRIREKNGIFTATEKTHGVGAKTRSIEKSEAVRSRDDISCFGRSDLMYQGYFETERCTVQTAEQVKLCIDKNRYCHFTDYELELEYTEEAAEAAEAAFRRIVEILHAHGKPITLTALLLRVDMTTSKSQRFFARLRHSE